MSVAPPHPTSSFLAISGVISDTPKYADLDAVLSQKGAEPFTLKTFLDHLEHEYCSENLRFWIEVETFKSRNPKNFDEYFVTLPDSVRKESKTYTQAICDYFIKEGSPQQINISHEQREEVLKRVDEVTRSDSSSSSKDDEFSVFDNAQEEVDR